MDQPPAVAFTAFADVWPRAAGVGNRRSPLRHWRGGNFGFLSVCTLMFTVSILYLLLCSSLILLYDKDKHL